MSSQKSDMQFPFPTSCSEYEKSRIKDIIAPVVVGVPPEDACRGLVMLPDGQLRHYGMRFHNGSCQIMYMASDNCGLSWHEEPIPPDGIFAGAYSPWSGTYLLMGSTKEGGHLSVPMASRMPERGTYVFCSNQGIDGPYTVNRISDEVYLILRPPVALRSRRRWVQPMQYRDEGDTTTISGVLLSDDDGRSWRKSQIPTAPRHEVQWPDKGMRWQNDACEPSVVELSDGRLWVLLRTSLNCFYESFSKDGGESWSPAQPSRFPNTITQPGMLRMRDGRLLVFWCNTVPLPELDHREYFGLSETSYQAGYGEDVFTNRDAFHAAVSYDEGMTWCGFRELLLNERRNDSDFRTVAVDVELDVDRSIHQNQAVELPEGKVLVAVGQNPLMRKLLIFDPLWLEEKTRKDDFSKGLAGWSTHQYVKSLLGMHGSAVLPGGGGGHGGGGHCAYNRRPGAQLMPDPDAITEQGGRHWAKEALLIARHPDPRLVYEPEGAVWNFPAGKSGRVLLRIRVPYGSQGARICLCDRWFNPVDPVVHTFAQYVMEIDRGGNLNKDIRLPRDQWIKLEIRWKDCLGELAEYSVDDSDQWFHVPLIKPSVNGISYIHIQSIAEGADPFGVLLGEVEANVID